MGNTRKNATSSGAPALDVRITTGGPASGPIEQPTAKALAFTDMVGKFIRPVSLSEAGKKYIDTLAELFANLPADNGVRIKVETVPNLVELRAVIDEVSHTYIILYFNESYTGNGMEPVVNMTPDMVKAVEGMRPDISFVQTITVAKEDYPRVEKMAAHIVNCFLAISLGNNIDAKIFHQMNLSPNTDIRAVRDFIDRRSPHEIQDRVDWGVLLEREVRQNPTVGYTADRITSREPVMAIGGYTKFLRVSSFQGDKIYPIAVITNITSDIPCQNILALALPIAATAAIVHGAWRSPYNTFGKDNPNLGYLVRDLATKELKWFANVNEMQEEISRSFFYPQLALDIPEGRAHIVGLENYYQNEALFDIMARNFFGKGEVTLQDGKKAIVDVWPGGLKTVSAKYINYEGTVTFEGKDVDTRTIDYLNIVNSMKSTNLQVDQFLAQFPNIDVRLKNIGSILGIDRVRPTYRAETIIFESPFINMLANYLQTVIRYTGEVNVNTEMNIASIFEAMGQNGAIQGNNAIYGSYAQMVTPVNLYGAR